MGRIFKNSGRYGNHLRSRKYCATKMEKLRHNKYYAVTHNAIAMTCCINPNCPQPINPDNLTYCQSCNTPLISLLRGRYRILKPLGKGGFSRTYLAEDTDNLNRRCVVKQLVAEVKSNWGLQKAADLFKLEAQQLQQLEGNPQIPGIYGYFEEDNCLYLIQQYIEGENLAQLLEQGGRWNQAQVRQLLLKLLPVLEFIHSRQVIHRDIKPENIIHRSRVPQPISDRHNLTPTPNQSAPTIIQDKVVTQTTDIGDLVLIDFGVSKQLSETVMVNPLGTRVGSDGYAALEQMRGGEAYAASDLYSLGVTCFHLLTGIHPFELWTEEGYGWTKNWRNYLPTPISPELGQIIDRLLQKDLSDRYTNAAEVLRDLNSNSHPLPVISHPLFMGLSRRRKPAKTIAIASAALLLLGTGGNILLKNTPPTLMSWITPVSAWNQARLGQTLTGHTARVLTVAITPDGKTLASGSDDNTVRLWSLQTFEHLSTLTGHGGAINSIAISPDGRVIASGSRDNTVKLWDLHSKQEIATLKGHERDITTIAFSRDGQTLASGSHDHTITLWYLGTNELIGTLRGHNREIRAVAFSPNGRLLASASQDNTVKLWDLNRREEISTLLSHDNSVNAIAFSRDGQTLISGSSDKTLKLWDVTTKEVMATLHGHSQAIKSIAVSPDGRIIASGGDDDTVQLWDLKNQEAIATLRGPSSKIEAIAFSPKRPLLVSGSHNRNLEIWQIPD
ncbi:MULTISPECIES: serine/threonine-protein kinase [Limnospira]|uniref:serine/threonine-protein kinase n=1 Tax=Limnospira TaxID=2596745 RepID=UPI0028E131A4|nr:serine/threonine-protein kinase [Limnospira sp. PMC 917.15]MDT9233670.1 serine/threonine protein kinase [Limnospira sp. PMC 917.15]